MHACFTIPDLNIDLRNIWVGTYKIQNDFFFYLFNKYKHKEPHVVTDVGPCLDISAPPAGSQNVIFYTPTSWFVNWHISQGVSHQGGLIFCTLSLLIADNCDHRPFGWRETFPRTRCVNNVDKLFLLLLVGKVKWMIFFFFDLFSVHLDVLVLIRKRKDR